MCILILAANISFRFKEVIDDLIAFSNATYEVLLFPSAMDAAIIDITDFLRSVDPDPACPSSS